MLNATQLADRLGVSKARVSQWVSEGKLAGCFQGDGRARRFDPTMVQKALSRGLDPGQMMGNGAATRKNLRDVDGDDAGPRPALKSGAALAPNDPDRYELARILSAEEDARRKRRDNERDEGRWVLAEEVERHTARALAREIGQFEVVLRDGARAVADILGVDFREVRKVLMDQWRTHRASRRDALSVEALAGTMSDVESEASI